MSDELERIFVEFYRANGIEAETVFGKGRVYTFQGREYSKDDLMGTPYFAGFTAGFTGSRNLYSSARKGDAKLSDLDDLETPLNAMGAMLDRLEINMEEGLENTLSNVDRAFYYDKQYQIGQAVREGRHSSSL